MNLIDAYLGALKMMESTGPRPLRQAATFIAANPTLVGEAELRIHLTAANPNDELRRALSLRLATFDHQAEDAAWTEDTAPNTRKRREVVLRMLDVEEATAALLGELIPIANLDEPIVIADEWTPWYTESIKRSRDFYWQHYSESLQAAPHLDPKAITALDKATDRVVERLADPTATEAYQAKGLVVGYVQSGKTANFTGVMAKAIDAGYRLIIVLSGTTDLLRTQTQRRLDMELVGQENLLRGIKPDDDVALDATDYVRNDPDWDRFVRHGVQPSDGGGSDLYRLTKKSFDYKSLELGISALDFIKRERHLPFFHPANLFTGDTRLLVVKKNSTVLKKLVADLNKITTRLEEVPTLIIDDESDQASVNTSRAKPLSTEAKKKRSAINRHIADLLRMLPRAQYVGYTATPFANVFIDPNDAEDIFPKNFLIALPPGPGYMGARDFHDLNLDIPLDERTKENSAEKAHVHIVNEDENEQDADLQRALDTFVLTGAVKLYRQSLGYGTFRHHTMLYHVAMQKDAHREQRAKVKEMWDRSGYRSASCFERLRSLYEEDILPVTRRPDGAAAPSTFDELVPFIGDTVNRIGKTGHPVLVVNSDKIEGEELDFATTPHVWRVLVGGNKLARGFTVEGLTVSFYLRRSRQADTMMQMGRWFGYRAGYRDLVRLYTTQALYDEFEDICQDEEFFRDELRQYAPFGVDGRPQITPSQIPPLVAQHHPKIKPTAANKMYNARVEQRRTPMKEPGNYPLISEKTSLKRNTNAFSPLLSSAVAHPEVCDLDGRPVNVLSTQITNEDLVSILSQLHWAKEDSFRPDLNYLRQATPDMIADWHVVLPQLKGQDAQVSIEGVGPLSVHRRRVINGKLQAKSQPADRSLVQPIANHPGSTRGGMLLYPMVPKDAAVQGELSAGDVVMAFTLFLPQASGATDGKLITWTTKDSSLPGYALVSV
ncbi:Z1 domain-containing protein [[Kitasatospora] papulosa]|uniref:Z1 domain-containing protein n=1 Tax=Streptomyces TaxID=1883 RepID=UPI002256A963|nr:Z1 domain-containing protein [[Kitasatospora] papulosa]MCX4414523.1 Z1 domain-containing protein [[Kitasatospora] papulosa]